MDSWKAFISDYNSLPPQQTINSKQHQKTNIIQDYIQHVRAHEKIQKKKQPKTHQPPQQQLQTTKSHEKHPLQHLKKQRKHLQKLRNNIIPSNVSYNVKLLKF